MPRCPLLLRCVGTTLSLRVKQGISDHQLLQQSIESWLTLKKLLEETSGGNYWRSSGTDFWRRPLEVPRQQEPGWKPLEFSRNSPLKKTIGNPKAARAWVKTTGDLKEQPLGEDHWKFQGSKSLDEDYWTSWRTAFWEDHWRSQHYLPNSPGGVALAPAYRENSAKQLYYSWRMYYISITYEINWR